MKCVLETNENVRMATGIQAMPQKGKILMMEKQVLIFLLTTMLLNQGEENGFIENIS